LGVVGDGVGAAVGILVAAGTAVTVASLVVIAEIVGAVMSRLESAACIAVIWSLMRVFMAAASRACTAVVAAAASAAAVKPLIS
jgi:hypothetical protein